MASHRPSSNLHRAMHGDEAFHLLLFILVMVGEGGVPKNRVLEEGMATMVASRPGSGHACVLSITAGFILRESMDRRSIVAPAGLVRVLGTPDTVSWTITKRCEYANYFPAHELCSSGATLRPSSP